MMQLWKVHQVAVSATGASPASVAAGVAGAAVAGAAVAIPVVSAITGIELFSEIWSMSARVRALFIPHTRTGNPLVDSVAEHRAPHWGVYLQYFNIMVYFGIFGFFWCCDKPKTDAKSFIALYCGIAGYFSSKMIRSVKARTPVHHLPQASSGTPTGVPSPPFSALLHPSPSFSLPLERAGLPLPMLTY